MITSEENFIIATPTKCGTTTMEAIARRHMRNAGADGDLFRIMDWDSPRRQHRMCLPPNVSDGSVWGIEHREQAGEAVNEWGDVQRYLFVRNPYTRYMSIYTYLSAPANYSQWGAREIQGSAWGGHDAKKRLRHEPMSFETFLYWLADKREAGMRNPARGDLQTGKAFRSPWVWTDSLTFSMETLRDQPGGQQGEEPIFLRLETIWDDLRGLDHSWGLGLDLSPIHANRSTAYGAEGADPGSHAFWGGIKCARRAFQDRVFNASWVEQHVFASNGCSCAACAIGVFDEARALLYIGD